MLYLFVKLRWVAQRKMINEEIDAQLKGESMLKSTIIYRDENMG